MGLKAIDKNTYCTKNFAWYELLKDQTEIPSLEVLNNLKSSATVLQKYKDKVFNGHTIYITCGWRSKKYNEELRKRGYKPAKNSQHLYGKALDFVVYGYNSQQVYALLDPVHFGGLERDRVLDGVDWTHIDLRNKVERFDNTGVNLKPKYNWDEHNKIFRTV